MKQSDIINGLMLSLGRRKYSLADLEYLCRPFDITPGNIRTYLSRSVKKGNFTVERDGRKAFYSHSRQFSIMTTAVAQSFHSLDWEGWDGTWRGVSFSVPEDEKPKRHIIRRTLTGFRFAPLNPGYWIRPCNPADDIEALAGELRKCSNARLMKLQFHDSIKKKDAAKLWNLERINSNFADGINLIKNKCSGGRKPAPAEALKMRIELGCRIIPLLSEDPLLPESLLPEGWKGNELRKMFFDNDRILNNQAEPYWNRIVL